jgi:CRISPR-associated protein Csx17
LEAPTLGSGGNVGNNDFSGLFVQLLPKIIPFNEGDALPPHSQPLLQAALFATPVSELSTSSIGQFDPGKAGGANAGQGMEASPLLNPWDYVLMLEGTLLLGGTVSRRQAATTNQAGFPFIVESSGVGYGSAGKDKTRGELWLPLWRHACSTREIKMLLGEGRAEIGRRRATSGVTFARAAASLGVDRGIDAFVRYEFQERLGQSYLASPLGHFRVRTQRNVDLLQEVDNWLALLRRACHDDTTPPRFAAALRRIDAAIFDFCRYGDKARMAEILCALGNAERELANGEKFRKTNKRTIQPVPLLSAAWILACDDGSAEFRLALALASIHGSRDGQVGNLRTNLEPVEHKGSRWTWAEQSRAVVWSGADLFRNLTAVLTRRVMDANRAGLDQLPLAGRFTTFLPDVSRFLNGAIHDPRLEELLWGLLLIDTTTDWHVPVEQLTKPQDQPLLLPSAYALLKLLFLPDKLSWPAGTEGVIVKPEPEILGRLRARDVDGACLIAARRLRASGVVPMPGPTSGRSWREVNFGSRVHAERLAAALLIPVRETTKLAQLVLRPHMETAV